MKKLAKVVMLPTEKAPTLIHKQTNGTSKRISIFYESK